MHPANEIRAAEVDAYLHTQGIVLTAAQRQWFEAYFAKPVMGDELEVDEDLDVVLPTVDVYSRARRWWGPCRHALD